jgi:DNA-directed RNA polymerase alpha subunit
MDAVTKEQVRLAMAKVIIALGYDVESRRYRNRPNIDMAMEALKTLSRSLSLTDESPIDYLNLSRSTVTELDAHGIKTIGQLAAMKPVELMQLNRISLSRVVEIEQALEVVKARRGC